MTVDPNTAPLSEERLDELAAKADLAEKRRLMLTLHPSMVRSLLSMARCRAQDDTSRKGEEPDPYGDREQWGMTFALRQFAAGLRVEKWEGGDGSESVEGDVWAEFDNIAKAGGFYVTPDGDTMLTMGPDALRAALSRPLEAAPVDGGEAVAWRYEHQFGLNERWHVYFSEQPIPEGTLYRNITPLYAHPAPAHPAGTDAKRIAELEEMVAGSIAAYRLMQKRANAAEAQLAALTDKSGNAELIALKNGWEHDTQCWREVEAHLRHQASVAEAKVEELTKERDEAREALKPFGDFGWDNTDTDGWTNTIHREAISEWFGPSDFRRALRQRYAITTEGWAALTSGGRDGQ